MRQRSRQSQGPPQPIQDIAKRPIVQNHQSACGRAVAARIIAWAEGLDATTESRLQDELRDAISEANGQHLPGGGQPQFRCAGGVGPFYTTPLALATILNSKLGAQLTFEVVACEEKGALVERVLPPLAAGLPVALLIDEGRHWVIAYDLKGDESSGFLIGILNPGREPTSGQPFDLWLFLRDHDLLGRPICRSEGHDGKIGDVHPGQYVAVVPRVENHRTGVVGKALAHLDSSAAELNQIDTGLALRRLCQFDDAWQRPADFGDPVPVRFEEQRDDTNPLSRVILPWEESGSVTAVLVFDDGTKRLLQAAFVDAEIKDLRYTRQNEIRAEYVGNRHRADQLWMAFRRVNLKNSEYLVRCDRAAPQDEPDDRCIDPEEFYRRLNEGGG